jgi:uncharacterized Zn-binding protein involved in type VI secretion
MGQPAARQDDKVVGKDLHFVVASGTPPFAVLLDFDGKITSETVATVLIEGAAAATVESVATNDEKHVPPDGTSFVILPTDAGTVSEGSTTVTIGGRPAARLGDPVLTCNDLTTTSVIVSGASTVTIG